MDGEQRRKKDKTAIPWSANV